MYGSAMLKQNHFKGANAYVAKDILEASPQKLLIKIYDFAIVHCKKGDMLKTNAALDELIHSLNFELEEPKEIATGLLRLYQFCEDQMRKDNTEIVYEILTTLRETWITAFTKKLAEE